MPLTREGYVFVGIAALAVIVTIIVIAVNSDAAMKTPGPYCYYVADPNFNKHACTSTNSDEECKKTAKEGYTPDVSKCRYSNNPSACTGIGRLLGCSCLLNSQCASFTCTLGNCTL